VSRCRCPRNSRWITTPETCSHAACIGVCSHNRDMKREQGDQVDGPPAGSGQSQGHSGPRHSDSGSQGSQSQGSKSQGSKSQGSVSKLHRTRTSIMWVTTLVGLVVLAFLLVFFLQNLDSTRVAFLGFSG